MMDPSEFTQNIRKAVLDHVELLASPSAQLKYERDVPIASVPSELVEGIVDDLPWPDTEALQQAFGRQGTTSLIELYGRLCVASDAFEAANCVSVADIHKVPEWRSVMQFAKTLIDQLKSTSVASGKRSR